MNIQKLMQQAQKLKDQMAEAQSVIHASEHEGVASGGLVRIKMKGNHKVVSVSVDPDLLKEDHTMVEDMITVALTDAISKIEQFTQEKTPRVAPGMGF